MTLRSFEEEGYAKKLLELYANKEQEVDDTRFNRKEGDYVTKKIKVTPIPKGAYLLANVGASATQLIGVFTNANGDITVEGMRGDISAFGASNPFKKMWIG